MRQSSTSSEACICAGTQTVKEQNGTVSDDAFLDCLSLLARECASVGKGHPSDNFGEARLIQTRMSATGSTAS